MQTISKDTLKVGVRYDIVDPFDRRYHFENVTFDRLQQKDENFLSEHAVFTQEGKEDLCIMVGALKNLSFFIHYN